jgi:hypothetical protein
MNLNEAIETLADVTLGESITTHEELRYVLADVEKGRRECTEEEYPEATHLDRLLALATIGKTLTA